MLISDLLLKQKDNKKIAIKSYGVEITYKEWFDKSIFLSNIINKYIQNDNENIGIFLPNSIEYAISYFGVAFSNKVIIPIGPQVKELELLSTLNYCEISLLITNSKLKDKLLDILKNYQYKLYIIDIDTYQTYEVNTCKPLIGKSNYLVNYKDENDVAIMLHTSGTTSNPKRVMLTHKNLISNIESNIQSLKLTPNDIVLIALPMYFGYCNTAQFLTHIYLGATIVIFGDMFFPNKFFKVVEEEKITNFTGTNMALSTSVIPCS